MSLVEFELPEEFAGVTYESILADMLAKIPKQYDKIEGSFIYDMVAPTALEVAELIQFWLALGIQTNFHMWAKGQWLDYHAHDCGLHRKEATHAYADLEITTSARVTFPSGFVFAVPSEDSKPAIEFETTQEYSFSEAGTYTLRVKAVEAGKNSNVAADSIVIMKNPIKNILALTNPEQVIGGTEAETDDSLRQRIDDFYAGHGASFVGNKADYERWAREVPGVGYAHCIPLYSPIWAAYFEVKNSSGDEIRGDIQSDITVADNEVRFTSPNNTTLTCTLLEYSGSNSVKIVIADEEGYPAIPELCAAVETYIFGTGHSDLDRLAPIGVKKYEVVPPSTKAITLVMSAKLSISASLVKKNIVAALTAYFKTLSDDDNFFGELRYSKVAAILSGVTGLDDFKNLTVGGGTENISFTQDEMPTIDVANITFNSW